MKAYAAIGTLEHGMRPHHALWYRYVPESGNWHDGTFTRKIEPFSAATCTPLFGAVLGSGLRSTCALAPGFPQRWQANLHDFPSSGVE